MLIGVIVISMVGDAAESPHVHPGNFFQAEFSSVASRFGQTACAAVEMADLKIKQTAGLKAHPETLKSAGVWQVQGRMKRDNNNGRQ